MASPAGKHDSKREREVYARMFYARHDAPSSVEDRMRMALEWINAGRQVYQPEVERLCARLTGGRMIYVEESKTVNVNDLDFLFDWSPEYKHAKPSELGLLKAPKKAPVS
jgi:hypothetical protein